MQKIKTTCLDIEVAIMKEYDFRTTIIVPNVSNMMRLVAFETDMLCLNKNGYATGFEIKISKSDLKAESKKMHIMRLRQTHNSEAMIKKYFAKFKFFNYAVSIDLMEDALELIPEFCGLYTLEKKGLNRQDVFKCVRKPRFLHGYKWSEKERYAVARLGCMRIVGLKQKLQKLTLNK